MAAGIAGRFQQVRDDLVAACRAAGRDAATVRLVAVSKLQPAAAVAEALRLGQRDFGENYAQELRDKRAELAADPSLAGALAETRWHFIGPLQRNKVNLVAGRACLIHSVDSIELVEAIAGRVGRLRQEQPELRQDLLIEVGVAGEAQKAGCPPSRLPALLDAVAAKEGLLRCRGLMCIPPQDDDPEASRPHFRLLRELARREQEAGRPHVELAELSMGMSHDFAVAIAEGATMVRIGTALFGARPARSAPAGT